MPDYESTCWTLIHGAAEGNRDDRADFARRYGDVVRAYLEHRWRATRHATDVDDAVSEVLLECFRRDGALQRVDQTRAGGFRAFLYGVTRNVARRFETRGQRRVMPAADLDSLETESPSLAAVFERAWAQGIMREAAANLAGRAHYLGHEARERVELLRLRFEEGMPIRDIAALWEVDPRRLHRDYERAREEYREALLEAMAFHHPGTRREIEAECRRLQNLLRT